jgi:hypothetical protein
MLWSKCTCVICIIPNQSKRLTTSYPFESNKALTCHDECGHKPFRIPSFLNQNIALPCPLLLHGCVFPTTVVHRSFLILNHNILAWFLIPPFLYSLSQIQTSTSASRIQLGQEFWRYSWYILSLPLSVDSSKASAIRNKHIRACRKREGKH